MNDYLNMTEFFICGSEVTSLLPSSSFTMAVLPKLISTGMTHHFKEMALGTGDAEAKLAHLTLYRSWAVDDEDGGDGVHQSSDSYEHYYSFVDRKCQGKVIFSKC